MLVVDPMHNLYLGIAKNIFHLIWVKRGIISSTSMDIITNRIVSLEIPAHSKISRLLPCIEGSNNFTVEQWMILTNYYSIYCLFDIIPVEHLECWRHFVLVSRLLTKSKLTQDELRVADALFLQFGKRFEQLYSRESVTPNINMHCHLASCVNDYDPISSFWLFPFERYNGLLGDQSRNNHSIEVQIMKRFVEDNSYLQLL